MTNDDAPGMPQLAPWVTWDTWLSELLALLE